MAKKKKPTKPAHERTLSEEEQEFRDIWVRALTAGSNEELSKQVAEQNGVNQIASLDINLKEMKKRYP
jgi:hypothetical protein